MNRTSFHSNVLKIATVLMLAAGRAWAANDIVGGALNLTRTFKSIGVEAFFTGDDNANAYATLEFKKQSDATWRQGLPLWRISDGTVTPGPAFYGSALLLEEGTAYDIRVKMIDPDGVANGVLTGNITTRAEDIPQASDLAPTHYVDPLTGSDSNAGTSSAVSWRTLQKAWAAAPSGAVVQLAPGYYVFPDLNTKRSLPITIKAQYPATGDQDPSTREVPIINAGLHSIVQDGTFTNGSSGGDHRFFLTAPAGTSADASYSVAPWTQVALTGPGIGGAPAGATYTVWATNAFPVGGIQQLGFAANRADIPKRVPYCQPLSPINTAAAWAEMINTNRMQRWGFYQDSASPFTLYIVLPNGKNPNDYWITGGIGGSSGVGFNAVGPDMRFTGIEARNTSSIIHLGSDSDAAKSEGTVRAVVDHCLITGAYLGGVEMVGMVDASYNHHAGKDHVIEHNRFVDTSQFSLDQANDPTIHWQFIKEPVVYANGTLGPSKIGRFSESTGVSAKNGATQVVIRRNTFDGFFNGVTMGGAPDNKNCRYPAMDTDIYENLIMRGNDDAIEPEQNKINWRSWDNEVRDFPVFLSVAPVSYGPLYVFRNKVWRLGAHGAAPNVLPTGDSIFPSVTSIKTNGSTSATAPARIYFLHNTVWSNQTDPNEALGGKLAAEGTNPHFFYLRNNVIRTTNRCMEIESDGTSARWNEDYDWLASVNSNLGNVNDHGAGGIKINHLDYYYIVPLTGKSSIGAYRAQTGQGTNTNILGAQSYNFVGGDPFSGQKVIDAQLKNPASGDISLKSASVFIDIATRVPNLSDLPGVNFFGAEPDMGYAETVPPDTTAPTARIVSPAANATVSGVLTISGTAADDAALSKVEISTDGATFFAATGLSAWTYALNTNSMATGACTITARATDASGNAGAHQISVTIARDVTSPVVSNVVAASLTQNSAVITWDTNEASDSQIVYGPNISYGNSTPLNAAMVTTHSQSLTGLLPDTVYHYQVTSRDSSGNVGVSGDRTFRTLPVSDTTQPTVAILSPAANSTVSGAIMISGTAADNVSLSKVEISTDGVRFNLASGLASWSYPLNTAQVANGARTITARATDGSGNAASVQVAVTVNNDVSPPAISNVAASNLAANSAVVSWTTNENADAQVEYGLTASYGNSTALNAAMSTSHSQALSGLSASTLYHYRVKSKDAAGNLATSADFTFTTPAAPDATAPTLAILAPSANSTVSGAIMISGTAADNVSLSKVEISTDGVRFNLASGLASWSYPLNTAQVANGARTITARATDGSGNAASVQVAVTVNNDVSPPAISNVAASNLAANSAVVSWTTNENADAQVEYGLTASYGNSTALNAAMSTSHSQALSGLSASTLYHYRVKSKDAAGNLATSADFTFTTPAAPDATAPTLAILAPSANSTVSGAITISGTAADNVSLSKVEISIDGGSFAAATGLASWSFALNTANLINGAHTVVARASDSGGNSATQQVIVTVNNDSTPPAISNVTASNITHNSVLITWTTNEPSDTQIEFGPTTAYENSTPRNASPVTHHSQTIGSLTPNSLYHFRVKSQDGSGNLSRSADATFKTAAAPDLAVPALSVLSPANGATLSGASVLSGTASDDAGISKVEISIDGAAPILAEGLASWSYLLNTASLSNGAHTLGIRVTDTSGNSRNVVLTVNVSNASVPPAASTTTISVVYDYQDLAQIAILIRSNDPQITENPLISVKVNFPSGSLGLPLTRVNAGTYYAKLSSSALEAMNFNIASNPYLTLVLPNGVSIVSKVERNLLIPALGGWVREESRVSGQSVAEVVIPPNGITSDAKLSIHPAPVWDKAQRDEALLKKNLKSMGEGREINFESSGTLQSAQLTLPFDRTLMPAGMSFNRLKIAYFNPRTGEWEIQDNTQVVGDTLQVQVTHFSLYAPVLQLPSVEAGEAQAFAYPNPVRNGETPKLKAFVGQAQSVDFTVFNLASQKVYEETLQGDPTGIENGEYYYEKEWSDAKASGVYFLVVRAHKADGSILRLKSKFAVIR